MADEWWRVDGPWRVLGGQRSGEPAGAAAGAAGPDGVSDSVYAPEVPAPAAPVTPPAVPPRPSEPPAPSASPASPEPSVPSVPPGQSAFLIARAERGGPPLSAADFPGWDSVVFDFPDERAAAPAPVVPEQRTAEPEPSAAADADGAGASPAPRRSFLTGRRPSPLVLLAAAVLVAGVVTGQLLALLAGWGLAYIAPRLGPLTRKFAALVIPLGTMTASSVWQWGRTQGRWGEPAPAEELGRAVWDGAPGVLRLAGALTAVFLLVVTLRRRKPAAEA
ncbi:hypothetical protein [Kitasatospora sp. NPDC004289]